MLSVGAGVTVSEISSIQFTCLPIFVLIALREFSKRTAYKINIPKQFLYK